MRRSKVGKVFENEIGISKKRVTIPKTSIAICSICHQSIYLEDRFVHAKEVHGILYYGGSDENFSKPKTEEVQEGYFCRICNERFKDISSIRKHMKNSHDELVDIFFKPWEDPESLFCDTTFLKDYFNKEPTKGKDCKEGS